MMMGWLFGRSSPIIRVIRWGCVGLLVVPIAWHYACGEILLTDDGSHRPVVAKAPLCDYAERWHALVVVWVVFLCFLGEFWYILNVAQ